MGTRLTIVAAAVSLTACGSSMALSTGARHGVASSVPCGPAAGARTLASGSSVRVYAVGGTVYGCSNHGHRSYLLGSSSRCNGAALVSSPVVVAGELAAFGLERCGVDTGSTQVTVRRLTDGRQLRSFAATTTGLPEAFQSVGSLALRSSGALAWIGVVHSIVRNHNAIEVRKADSGAPAVTLDSGAAVAPGSLRVHAGRISWKHGTATRTAPLS